MAGDSNDPAAASSVSHGQSFNASSSSSSPTLSAPSSNSVIDAPVSDSNREELLAQATRFLTSAKVSISASDEDKRDFLRTKGLTEVEIERAFESAKSPVEGLAHTPSQPATDEDPFDRAARQFDDPINSDSLAPPPKSYPKSPLALYYDAPSQAVQQSSNHQVVGKIESPLTRYQVLLRFFRTLSFMMMLGGGLTALMVSAYRAYILPKITAMFDARSIVLKHHILLFDKIRETVNGLATYAPTQSITKGEGSRDVGATNTPRKGVLKKVHFNDEASEKEGKEDEKEGAKSTQHSEKVVLPSTDVVVDAKTPLLSETGDSNDPEEGENGSDDAAPKLEPIDLMLPLRTSLARLAETLKADMSSSVLAATAADSLTSRSSRSATVEDAGSGSDEWEDDEEASDDGLEFDPYGAYQKKLKHTQATSTSASSSTKAKSASLQGLKTVITSLNADISTHAFAASSSSTYSSMYPGSFRFGPGTTSSNQGGDGGNGSESPKSGDLGQVKAEIRSLKGLLLSRRNFPSYAARPPPPPLPATGAEARSTSAVV